MGVPGERLNVTGGTCSGVTGVGMQGWMEGDGMVMAPCIPGGVGWVVWVSILFNSGCCGVGTHGAVHVYCW